MSETRRSRLSRQSRTRQPKPVEASMSSPSLSAETLVSVRHVPAAEEGRSSRLPSVSPLSPSPTYVGVAVVLIGFVLLAITWGQVAGETVVAAQLPYFVSGGLVGL